MQLKIRNRHTFCVHKHSGMHRDETGFDFCWINTNACIKMNREKGRLLAHGADFLNSFCWSALSIMGEETCPWHSLNCLDPFNSCSFPLKTCWVAAKDFGGTSTGEWCTEYYDKSSPETRCSGFQEVPPFLPPALNHTQKTHPRWSRRHCLEVQSAWIAHVIVTLG